jgi:hypothetical protein
MPAWICNDAASLAIPRIPMPHLHLKHVHSAVDVTRVHRVRRLVSQRLQLHLQVESQARPDERVRRAPAKRVGGAGFRGRFCLQGSILLPSGIDSAFRDLFSCLQESILPSGNVVSPRLATDCSQERILGTRVGDTAGHGCARQVQTRFARCPAAAGPRAHMEFEPRRAGAAMILQLRTPAPPGLPNDPATFT